jgi:hypothetical protein
MPNAIRTNIATQASLLVMACARENVAIACGKTSRASGGR